MFDQKGQIIIDKEELEDECGEMDADELIAAASDQIDAMTEETFDPAVLDQYLDALDAAGDGGGDEAVPAVFICPISLEPMVDPVTLCTGQTYERANISRWLALGHRTCPTTMQELWDDALTTQHHPPAAHRRLVLPPVHEV